MPKDGEVQALLYEYFQLSTVNLEELYTVWSKDKYFRSICPCIPGLRILQQDPWECTISFLVSQNNNIKRITSCLNKIRASYGDKIGDLSSILDEDEEFKDFEIKSFFTFPTWDQLSKVTENEFRELGLGYRARYIQSSVEVIKEKGGEDWVRGLRLKNPIEEHQEEHKDFKTQEDTPNTKSHGKEQLTVKNLNKIREQLMELKGVGKKVADWIALFSLNCHHSIPVDTHIFQIANRVYGKGTKDTKDYGKVVELFNEKFGPYWGWAHSVLFAAELPQYKMIIESYNSKKKRKRKTEDVMKIEEVEVKRHKRANTKK